MSFIIVSTVVSILLMGEIYVLAGTRHRMGRVCLLTGVISVLLVPFLPAVSLHSFGSLVVSVVCWTAALGRKAMLVGSLAVMLASYGFLLFGHDGDWRELARMREKYPLESVKERLSYEEGRPGQEPSPPALAHSVEQRLAALEDQSMQGYRSSRLEMLHNRTADDFVLAQGFGFMRMPRISTHVLELRETPPVRLATLPEAELMSASSDADPRPLAAPRDLDQVHPAETELLNMHDRGLVDFFDRERMGYVQDRRHVAGFEPHKFSAIPPINDTPWQVVRLELVSLLKHPTPLVYLSRELPQLDKLAGAPTRVLNAFERKAIERLRADDDLVIEENHDWIRMVGSLRAAKNCLECHSVRRGELLGALSYELVRIHSRPAPKSDGKSLGPSS